MSQPILAFLVVVALASSAAILVSIDVFRRRFMVVAYRSFSYFGAAFNLLLLAFSIFFLTEALELYIVSPAIESTLNALSTVLILVSQIVLLNLIWRIR